MAALEELVVESMSRREVSTLIHEPKSSPEGQTWKGIPLEVPSLEFCGPLGESDYPAEGDL
jgi:hypothetical protein